MATYLGGDMPLYWPAIEELEERQRQQATGGWVPKTPSTNAEPTGMVAVPRPGTTPTDPTRPTDPSDPSSPSTPPTQNTYRSETVAQQWTTPPAAAQPPARGSSHS